MPSARWIAAIAAPKVALCALLAAAGACRKSDPPEGLPDQPARDRVPPAVAGSAAVAASAPRAFPAPRAGERLRIEGGPLLAGSVPGDDGRDPHLEPASLDVTLGPFEMDRLPYPNDPAQHARTDVGRDDAARLCHERGERLCTELEWERACKGPSQETYASGDAWDPACTRDLSRCPSGFGLLGMGALREWTASDLMPEEKGDRYRPVVRGAPADAEATAHRCAHRSTAESAERGRDLGFRCCQGAPNAAVVPAARLGPTVRKETVDPKKLSEIFATFPELARVKDNIRLFSEPDDVATVLRKGQSDVDQGSFTLTTSPLLWNPAPGEDLLVVAGRTKKDAFIVALYRLPQGRFRLASSMVFVDDVGPFALAFNPYVRERILWSSCWRCSGEGGAVTFRDGRRVVIVQQ